MPHDLALVHAVVRRLEAHGCAVRVFGGWAEELRGVVPPRPHRDVDLLLRAGTFERVDALLAASPDLVEVGAEHLPHERAFEQDGTVVELLLVTPGLTTPFWGAQAHAWPEDVFDDEASWPPLASAAALRRYREVRPPPRPRTPSREGAAG